MDMQKKYSVSREKCQEDIEGVCSACGGEIEPIETTDNAHQPTFWSGCVKCNRFDYGVKEEVFKISEALFRGGYRHYSHIHDGLNDSDELKHCNRKSHISGGCGLVRNVLRLRDEI